MAFLLLAESKYFQLGAGAIGRGDSDTKQKYTEVTERRVGKCTHSHTHTHTHTQRLKNI